jgi:DNA-binding GntR family transcriptional regulator
MEESLTTLRPLRQNETLGEQAYFAIRRAIISGTLQPGDRITERDLASRLHVSPTPVREALRQLEQEGLVLRTPNREVTVSDMSTASVTEMFLLLATVRGVAARLAAQKITDAEVAEIQALLQQNEEVLETGPAELELELADRFHALVHKASRNQTLMKFLGTIMAFDPLDRLESLPDRQRARERLEEHKQIAAALASRDREGAETLMRSHVLRAAQLVIRDVADV